MYTVDTYEYISMLRDLVEEGHEVSVKISGNSMAPFLRENRDTAYFKAPDRELMVGDIVFFQRANGQFILHRIYKIELDRYYLVGDAQREIEGPVLSEQIFAIVTSVERNGKIVKPGDMTWDFFAKFWLKIIPLRSKLIRICDIFN